MKTAEFKTTWGEITLTLDGDNVVALDLPHLKTAPRNPFEAEFSNGWKNSSGFFQGLEKSFQGLELPAARNFSKRSGMR
jgi:hypothetical protein